MTGWGCRVVVGHGRRRIESPCQPTQPEGFSWRFQGHPGVV